MWKNPLIINKTSFIKVIYKNIIYTIYNIDIKKIKLKHNKYKKCKLVLNDKNIRNNWKKSKKKLKLRKRIF